MRHENGYERERERERGREGEGERERVKRRMHLYTSLPSLTASIYCIL